MRVTLEQHPYYSQSKFLNFKIHSNFESSHSFQDEVSKILIFKSRRSKIVKKLNVSKLMLFFITAIVEIAAHNEFPVTIK